MNPVSDRIRTLAARLQAQGQPLQYEELPRLLAGDLEPSTTDLACIADEAGVTIELLLGTRPRRPVLDYCDLWPLSIRNADGRASIRDWITPTPS
ncbi:transporter [Streptomyces sp. NBC_01142]|uniref:transporter n=1 Tax=Streptomyces sp. NBC_01142 TaxID=2975865 RepID=UPI002253D791|nr:transporter [Streptomyces sp. NBC_01142]MCX4826628.1 transporter [Streptomyces sp. NBC_01142]